MSYSAPPVLDVATCEIVIGTVWHSIHRPDLYASEVIANLDTLQSVIQIIGHAREALFTINLSPQTTRHDVKVLAILEQALPTETQSMHMEMSQALDALDENLRRMIWRRYLSSEESEYTLNFFHRVWEILTAEENDRPTTSK